MLVLTRKSNQSVVLGHDLEVRVTVLSVDGQFVKIGFEADSSINIVREELLSSVPETEDIPPKNTLLH